MFFFVLFALKNLLIRSDYVGVIGVYKRVQIAVRTVVNL